MIRKHEVDSSTKLFVAMLVLRVYARLLLLPFFHLLSRRTQVVEPPSLLLIATIELCAEVTTELLLPSIELCAGVTMELFAVSFYVVTQPALIFLLLCFGFIEFSRIMA